MDEDQVTETVLRWVRSVVIDLNLCPFARREIDNDRVRFQVTNEDSQEGLLLALQAELTLLIDDSSIETTLLIHPHVLQDFFDYNQFLDLADRLLVEMELDGVVQIASFHPRYQFRGTDAEDAENFTNRSPYPMLHLIREDSLARAIASYPDIDQVPARNIERMKSMGATNLKALLQACYESSTTDPV